MHNVGYILELLPSKVPKDEDLTHEVGKLLSQFYGNMRYYNNYCIGIYI